MSKMGGIARFIVAGIITFCFFYFFPAINDIIGYLQTAAASILGELDYQENALFEIAPYVVIGAMVFWGVYYVTGKMGGSGDNNNG